MNKYVIAIFFAIFFSFTKQLIIKNSSFENDYTTNKKKRAAFVENRISLTSTILKYSVDPLIDFIYVKVALSILHRKTCFVFYRVLDPRKAMFYFKYGNPDNSPSQNKEKTQEIITMGTRKPEKSRVIRELLLRLGIDYEHNRFDRDAYVTVYHRDIKSKYKHLFTRKPYHVASSFELGYDYRSLMHIGKHDFAKERKVSIEAKENLMDVGMGYAKKPTFNDIKLVNRRFCWSRCKKKLQCLNYGYTDPNNCKRCICLKFFYGTFCEYFAPNSYLLCHRYNHFKSSSKMQSVTILLHGDCHYFFTAKKGKRVLLKVTKNRPRWYYGCGGFDEFIEVRYKKDKSVSGPLVCPYWSTLELISEEHVVIVDTKYRKEKYLLHLEYKEI
uniref:Metalloendopeptidase n=1 Tax=Strongyloides stercoralis TaxID=6248 RepID=A0A0K0EBB8_STRER